MLVASSRRGLGERAARRAPARSPRRTRRRAAPSRRAATRRPRPTGGGRRAARARGGSRRAPRRAARRRSRARRSPRTSRRPRRPTRTTRTPLPSYPPRGVFTTADAAVRVEEVAELGGVVHRGPVGHRHAERRQALAHVQLVLGDGERRRVRGGPATPACDELGEHRLRHVLVIEGHHVDVAREGEDRRRIPVVADGGRRDRGRAALGLGEHPQVDAELDRGGIIMRASCPPPMTPTLTRTPDR